MGKWNKILGLKTNVLFHLGKKWNRFMFQNAFSYLAGLHNSVSDIFYGEVNLQQKCFLKDKFCLCIVKQKAKTNLFISFPILVINST